MPWNWLIGQDRAAEALKRVLASGRVAHAYLFHGPDGAGKRAAALGFAQALLCETRGKNGASADEACGRCLPCTKVARLIHPDVHVFLPYPKESPEDPLPDDYGARLARLAADPYRAVDYRRVTRLDAAEAPSNKQVEHRLRPVERVRRALTLRPAEAPRTVALLTDVDAMRTEAANAFLKLLEEPAPHVVLILTAERPERVLPTVLSRCQRVRFDPLSPEEIEGALVARAGADPQRAAFLARMADGSYTRAVALATSPDLAAHRALAVAFVRQAFTGRADRLAPLIEQANGLGREQVKGLFALMLGWVRDLVLAREAGPEAPLVNVDQAEAVRNFVAHLPAARLDAMAGLIEEAAALVERNVHTTLVLTVLAHALQEAMHGRARASLFAPLDRPALTA